MSEYKQVIFDILSPLTEQAEKELLADEPLKDQIMAMRKMSGTVQSIMNLYSRKHVLEGARIDVKMAELKKELEAAKKLPAVTGYDEEQKKLKQGVSELAVFIEAKEQKSSDISQFIEIIRKYSEIIELTPEIMHELIEKIVVHAPDKSSGHRVQQIDIYYRFNIAVASAVADSMIYDKKRKIA